jgi:predicted acylesterase/phospholipase RssA
VTQVDLILSSGFLAFGSQSGFLEGVEELGLDIAAVVGTSSGALAGALWCAGLPAQSVFDELCAASPLAQVRANRLPWRGLLSLEPVVARLEELLPATFEDLTHSLAVGVVVEGEHRLVSSGPLPRAVAASIAVPWLFQPILLDGQRAWDGGAADRTGLAAWSALGRPHERVLHLVERSAGARGPEPVDATVVRSPRSGARLWNLGPVQQRREQARAATLAALAPSVTG